MGFDERDLRAWSVRDSGELWRKPFRSTLSHNSSSVSSSVEDSPEGLKKGGAFHTKSMPKQSKLPPRSPRATGAGAPAASGEPKLELSIQSLSPRLCSSDERTAQRGSLRRSIDRPLRRWPASNKFDKLEALQPNESSSGITEEKKEEESCGTSQNGEPSPVRCLTGADTNRSYREDESLFSGMDLENQKDILTDESEIDFWECQKEAEESSYFCKPGGVRDSLLLDTDDTTTICTLNGERVVMQTNIAYQHHTEQELSGYAKASKEYLESQQHVMDYFEELQAENQRETCHEDFQALQDSCEKQEESGDHANNMQQEEEKQEEVAPTVSVSRKRRWPRIQRGTISSRLMELTDQEKKSTAEGCSSSRSSSSIENNVRTRRPRPSKKSGKPVVKKTKTKSANGNKDCKEDKQEQQLNDDKPAPVDAAGSEEPVHQPCVEDKHLESSTEECSKSDNRGEQCPELVSRQEDEEQARPEAEAKVDVKSAEAEDDMKSAEAEAVERNSLSAEKFCSIMSFLRCHAENSSPAPAPKSADTNSPRTVLEQDDAVSVADSTFTSASLAFPEVDTCSKVKPADLAFSGIKNKIQDLKEKILKQKKRIEELAAEKENLRLEKNKELFLEREKYSKELQDQAQEYKAAIKKHLSISEKLMKDKEALSERCCSLSMAEAKFEEKMKAAKQEWGYELKKQKEAWNAGEKSRREAWIEKKTKEIKEMTIVGLEPHIESIHETHRKELEALEEKHAEDVRRQLQKQSLKHRDEMSEMREQMLKERDEILDKERLAAHSRINEMAEKYEQQALQQRMRIANDLAQQLERSEASRRDDKQYTQELLARCQKEAAEREEALRKHHEKQIDELQTKQQDELSSLKHAMDLERTEWKRDLHEHVVRALRQREPEIEARCFEERNREIEMIIDRMEREKEELLAEHRRERTSRVEELLQERKMMLKKLKDSEEAYMDLCKSTLEGKAQVDTERAEMNSRVDELRAVIRNQNVVISQLKEQMAKEKQGGQKERERFDACISKLEQHNRSISFELQKSRSEVEQLRVRKVEELAELESKVKLAIEKKDEIISGLRSQLDNAHHQIRHTEQLLLQEHNILFS